MPRAKPAALLSLAACLLLGGRPAPGQPADDCEGPFRYDTPIDVAVEDLAAGGAVYQRRVVRTKGEVETRLDARTRRRVYRLRDGVHRLAIEPCRGVFEDFEDMAARVSRLQVTGLFSPGEPAADGTSGAILFWSFSDVTPAEPPQRRPPGMPLGEALSAGPSPDRRTLRVVGQFGGRILLGDLPADSQPDPAAWVLRDGRQAVWVIGRRPEGSGWKLDPAYPPDTARWLEVEGRLEPCGQVTCLRARRVALTRLPSS